MVHVPDGWGWHTGVVSNDMDSHKQVSAHAPDGIWESLSVGLECL